MWRGEEVGRGLGGVCFGVNGHVLEAELLCPVVRLLADDLDLVPLLAERSQGEFVLAVADRLGSVLFGTGIGHRHQHGTGQ